jgi:hypothetical protein
MMGRHGVKGVAVHERTNATASGLNESLVPRKALQRAGEELGLSAQAIGPGDRQQPHV